MTARPSEFFQRPIGLLTGHFFHALFDFGVFTQEGADAFVRVILGLIALLISLGLLLVRIYVKKYAVLSAAPTSEPYAHAVLADSTLAIALPMWIIALATVLVSGSLFPDETDFRVLTPLPIRRNVVFGAKLLALALFAGIFTLAGCVAVTPFVMRISVSRWATSAPALGVLAFWMAGVLASAFAVVAVVAVNGLLMTCAPRKHLRAVSAAMRSGMLAILVLALPFMFALPAQSLRFAQHSRLLFLAPPAWFMGLERALLGHRDAYFLQLTRLAVGASAVTVVLAVSSYVILYRRFDRVVLRSFGVPKRGMRYWRTIRHPARAAVRDFTAATLRRSPLHQGVVIGLSACGVALAIDGLIRAGMMPWFEELHASRREILSSVAALPFPLIIVLGIAARTALALPIEPKANWIFRMTEDNAIRVDELRAAERVLTFVTAFIPVALTFPFQCVVAGPRGLMAAAITSMVGLLWMEALLWDWRRIPFTCSYMPGKHSVAQSCVIGLSLFVVVNNGGSALETATLRASSPVVGLIVVAVLTVPVLAFRRRRRRKWREMPLIFDDELPSDVQCLRLSGDLDVLVL